MSQEVHSRIAQLVEGNDVVLFMKGTPLFPQCGFSSRANLLFGKLGLLHQRCPAG